MRIIGITGGIGSGKSTVSRILFTLGAKIIDADVVARKVVSKGEPALTEILQNFGETVLDDNGELNRRKLSEMVFSDPERLNILNGITHKYITEDIAAQIEKEKEERNYDTIVIDVPLPYEHGFIDTVDEIWVVTANKETRIRRAMERSGISYEDAVNRINAQMSEHEYAAIGDVLIDNNTDIIDLEKNVVKLYYKPANEKDLE